MHTNPTSVDGKHHASRANATRRDDLHDSASQRFFHSAACFETAGAARASERNKEDAQMEAKRRRHYHAGWRTSMVVVMTVC